MNLASITSIFALLEGPYKWYVITVVVILLTAFFTRFVFKTIKWFLVIIAIGILILAVNYILKG